MAYGPYTVLEVWQKPESQWALVESNRDAVAPRNLKGDKGFMAHVDIKYSCMGPCGCPKGTT